MKNRFFIKNQAEFEFEWNSAKKSDWPILKRNFVAAYMFAYKDRRFDELEFDIKWKQYAEDKWNRVYEKAIVQGVSVLMDEIIYPLQLYLNYESQPLEKECAELLRHFSDPTHNISDIRENLIKLMMLQNYFEHEFLEEKQKIISATNQKDYLIVRFHTQPVAFFVCELNNKSGHVYLRFVTIAPAFHRLGLGGKSLEHIEKYYPEATGMELYTRKANYSAQAFYKHCGFQETSKFDFDMPTFMSNQSSTLHLPNDDATSQPEAFIAFSKLTHSYRG